MTSATYQDLSHPSWFYTVQGLYPPVVRDERPSWHAVFFADTHDDAKRSMAWALDADAYEHVIDLRIVPPSLDRPRSGFPWDSPSARRKAARAVRESDKRAEQRRASARPSPEPERVPDPPTAPATPTTARRSSAAERFRAATRRKHG